MALHHVSRTLPSTCMAALALAGCVACAHAGEVDRYLPADSQIVVNVNVRQLVDSELFKKHALESLKDALKGVDLAEEILKDLGFDPFKDLDRLILASPGGSDNDRGLVIAHGRFASAKFRTKAEELGKTNGDLFKILKVPDGKSGHFLVYQVSPEGPTALFVALVGEKTLLVSPGKDYVVDALRKSPTKDSTPLKDRDFQALLETVDDRQTVSLAAESTALVKSLSGAASGLATDMLAKITAVGGGVTLGEEVKLEIAVSAKTAAEAKDFHGTADKGLKLALGLLAALGQDPDANPGLDLALEVVKSLRVSIKDRTVVVRGHMSADTIAEAVKKIK